MPAKLERFEYTLAVLLDGLSCSGKTAEEEQSVPLSLVVKKEKKTSYNM